MSDTKKGTGEYDAMRRSQVADSIMHGQAQVARQSEQIRNISEENDQIKKEIAAISGTHYDYVKADKLAILQGEVDALERRYQFEKMRKNDLTKRYQLARIDLLHSRKMKGGVNVEKEQADAVQRQVEILENRLDQALGKFNDALSYNKGLRDQIDIIRGERRVFQRVHKCMEDDLRDKKRTMADCIEQSNRDMDERDEYMRQAEQLQRAIAEQQQMYNDQVREMDVAMLEIKTMREDQTNLQLELEAREYEFESRLTDGNVAPAANTIANNSQNSMAAFSDDGESEFGLTTNVFTVDRETATITDILTQIREAIHDDDLDAVRQEFLRLGDSNFSLYKYINELTSTKEALSDEIRDLKLLLSEEDESEKQQRRLIKELEEKLAATEMKLDRVRLSIDHLRDAVATAVSTTEDVYTQIGCPSMEGNLNAGDTSCTDSNLLSFLGVIEERATHILCAFQSRHRRLELGITAPDSHRLNENQSPAPTEADPNSEANDRDRSAATPGGNLSPILLADKLNYEAASLLPLAPTTAHNAVSAQRLVKVSDLPCANLGAAETGGNLIGDLDEDTVVSHKEIRKQMELRLMAKRDREERALRKKKELKELIATTPRRHK